MTLSKYPPRPRALARLQKSPPKWLAARFSVAAADSCAHRTLPRTGIGWGWFPSSCRIGRLLWPADEVAALIAGRPVKADPEKIDEHFARKAADASKVLPHIRAKTEAKAKRLAGEVAMMTAKDARSAEHLNDQPIASQYRCSSPTAPPPPHPFSSPIFSAEPHKNVLQSLDGSDRSDGFR
jgi:hypothetical protein